MRLAVNGWRAHGQRTGVGRYLINVVSRWDRSMVGGRFDDITFYSHLPLDPADVRFPDNLRERVLTPAARMVVWENLRFGPAANEDVLFCPSYSRPIVARGATVVTVHDSTSQIHPQLYGRSAWFYNRLYGWSARQATLVITTTEAARQDISRCWGAPLDRIRVTPLAAAEFFKPLTDASVGPSVRERYLGAPVPYFLFVGKTTGRRRLPLLIEAFAGFKRATGLPHKLLLVGSKPSPEMDEVVGRLELSDDVRYSGFVTDDELNRIYNGAEAVIAPSVYEALTFPILEAQATGTPVICVEAPGSREITGGAAWFMPRLDVENLVGAMTAVARDETLRRDLRDGGLAHSSGYSWDRTARETLDVLAEAGATVSGCAGAGS